MKCLKPIITLLLPLLCYTLHAQVSSTNSADSTQQAVVNDGGENYQEQLRISPERIRVETIIPTVTTTPTTNPPPPNKERKVYWIHGLGGSQGSWAKAAEASEHQEFDTLGFQARILQSHKATYDENAGLLGAADDLRDFINGVVPEQIDAGGNPNTNFMIGHSQGGIVGKSLLYEDHCGNPMPTENLYYGGLITFGSALNGAQILNSRDNGLIEQLLNESCHILSNQVLSDLGLFGWALLNIAVGEEGQDRLCSFLSGPFINTLFSTLNSPITNDYVVGSPLLETINDCEANDIYKVAFYGVEQEDNIFWRTLEYFQTSPNSFPHWEANEDQVIVDAAQEKKMVYLAKNAQAQANLNVLNALGLPCSGIQWINWPTCSAAEAIYHKNKSQLEATQAAADWIDDINDNWKAVIGALSYETETIPSYTCLCTGSDGNGTGGPVANTITDPNDCPTSCNLVEEGTVTIFTLIEKESDGVVLAESASYMTGNTYDPQELKETSHMQMRNNSETRDALTNLYNGDFGMFFHTTERE